MHKLNLVKTHTTGTGSVHVQVLIDGNDVGMLYLTQKEALSLTDTIRSGTINTGVVLTCDIFNDELVEDDLYDSDIE